MSELNDFTIAAAKGRNETRRRMWTARDNVTRLRAHLADAEAAMAAAEREDDEALGLLTDAWTLLRTELTAPKPTEGVAA